MSIDSISRLTVQSNFKIERLDPSINELPFEVIAGALPEDRLQRNLLLAYYAGDHNSLIDAGYLLHTGITIEYAIMNHWKCKKGVNIYKAIAFQAVIELVDQAICKLCNGNTGTTMIDGQAVSVCGYTDNFRKFNVCDRCGGSGIKNMTKNSRYRAIQTLNIKNVPFDNLDKISFSDWMNTWSARFDAIYDAALKEFNSGVRHVNRELRDIA